MTKGNNVNQLPVSTMEKAVQDPLMEDCHFKYSPAIGTTSSYLHFLQNSLRKVYSSTAEVGGRGRGKEENEMGNP